MKILIIGEYSGFAKNLSSGFRKMGHEVVVFGDHDGWKKINVDNNGFIYPFYRNFKLGSFSIKRSWIMRGIYYFPYFKRDIKKFDSYFDIALIVNYEFLRLSHEFWYPRFSIDDIKFVLNRNGKIYLSACGDDYVYYNYTPKFRYTPFTKITNNRYLKPRLKRIFTATAAIMEGVIPVMYDYAEPYRFYHAYTDPSLNVLQTIPLPIDVDNFIFNNIVCDKIIIFHGKSRTSKGSDIISRTLMKLQMLYPDKVEVIVEGGIPLDEYLKILNKGNVIVDQCWGYSYGMNALFSMAMGKVVLSGNEPECAQEFKRDVPIVNILPDENDILQKLEQLIADPESIMKQAVDGFKFVSEFHSDIVVASQYLQVFRGDK